jgi:hypothetical protein
MMINSEMQKQYDQVREYPTGKILVAKKNEGERLQYGLYNANCKLILNCQFNRINVGDNIDMAIKDESSTQYFYDENGVEKFKIDGLLQMPYKFEQGFCCIYKKIDGKSMCAFINENGVQICDFIYQMGFKFSEGYASVQKGEYYGMIDSTGKEVLSFEYDYVTNLRNGFALVKKGELYGLLNNKMELITEIKYNTMAAFENGRALIELDGKKGYLNAFGKEFWYND